MISEKWDEKVIELAKSLINCQSYSGHEDKAAEVLKAYMKETGVFDEIETDCYGNVIGHIKGKNHGHQNWQVKEYQTDGHIKSLKKACFFLHDILLLSFFLVHPLHQTHGDQNNHRQNHGNGTSEIPVSN